MCNIILYHMKKENDSNNYISLLYNPTVIKLIKNSYLTHIQTIILVDYLTKKKAGHKIKQKNDKVKIGKKEIRRETYYRILKTAKEKVSKAIITLILATSLDVISHHDVILILEKISSLDFSIQNLEIYEELLNLIKRII